MAKSDQSEYQKQYRKNNKDRRKKWEANNQDKLRGIKNKYKRKRRINDVGFRLRGNISRSILQALKINNSSKQDKSILDNLPYNMNELKQHIELLFEPWMNWNNYGIYDPKKWDDNDSKTWTWHIDHIVPQSKLIYTSMKDETFRKCWSLDNLRPLSAKQNVKDGNRSVRPND